VCVSHVNCAFSRALATSNIRIKKESVEFFFWKRL